MKPFVKFTRKNTLAAAVCMAVSAPIWAQQLEEIIVTAERREANLQETAISITAMSADNIEQLGIRDLRELAEFVPNLTIMPTVYGDLAPAITIRGIGGGVGFQSFGAAAERAVAFYIDGLYYARSFGSVLNVMEMEGVDVLRGPQGTLFGRNTTGGAINMRTKKATTDEMHGHVNLAIGSFGQQDIRGNVNVPLSDSWAVRVGLGDLSRDGHVKRNGSPLNNTDTKVGALQIHGEPTDRLTMDINLMYNSNNTNGIPSNMIALEWDEEAAAIAQPGDITGGLRGHFGALSKYLALSGAGRLVPNDPRILLGDREVAGFCILNDDDPFNDGDLCDTFRRTHQRVASVKVSYDINDNVQFSSLSGVIDGSVSSRTDGYYTGAYARDFDQGSRSIQQEFQLNWNYDRWHAVAGLVYFGEDATEYELTTERLMITYNDIPVSATNPFFIPADADVLRRRRMEIYTYSTQSWAMFGQASYAVTDKIELTGGLRQSSDKKDGFIQLLPTGPSPLENLNRAAQGANSWDSTDYRLAAEFKPVDDLMVFISRTKAFKAGVADDAAAERSNNNIPIAPIGWVEPEEVISTEVGVRSEWMDRRLRVNLTAYDQDWTNRQSISSQVINDVLVLFTVNAADINSRGFELETMLAITDSLTATYNYGATRARSADNPNFRLDSVPRYNYTLGLTHNFTFGDGAMLNSSVNYSYRAGAYSFNVTEPDEDNPAYNPGYGLIGARIGFTPASGNWNLSIFGNNLADKNYTFGSFAISGYAHTSFAGAGPYNANPLVAYEGLPRTLGASFRYNF